MLRRWSWFVSNGEHAKHAVAAGNPEAHAWGEEGGRDPAGAGLGTGQSEAEEIVDWVPDGANGRLKGTAVGR